MIDDPDYRKVHTIGGLKGIGMFTYICQFCGRQHSPSVACHTFADLSGYEPDPPGVLRGTSNVTPEVHGGAIHGLPPDRTALRIEALRAATQVVSARQHPPEYMSGTSKADRDDTIWLADQFFRYLEGGDA